MKGLDGLPPAGTWRKTSVATMQAKNENRFADQRGQRINLGSNSHFILT